MKYGISFLLITLLFISSLTALADNNNMLVITKINGNVLPLSYAVTTEEASSELSLYINSLRARGKVDIDKAFEVPQYYYSVIKRLIDSKFLLIVLDLYGPAVSDEEFEKRFNNLLSNYSKSSIEADYGSIDAYKSYIKKSLIRQMKYEKMLDRYAKITDKDLEDYFNKHFWEMYSQYQVASLEGLKKSPDKLKQVRSAAQIGKFQKWLNEMKKQMNFTYEVKWPPFKYFNAFDNATSEEKDEDKIKALKALKEELAKKYDYSRALKDIPSAFLLLYINATDSLLSAIKSRLSFLPTPENIKLTEGRLKELSKAYPKKYEGYSLKRLQDRVSEIDKELKTLDEKKSAKKIDALSEERLKLNNAIDYFKTKQKLEKDKKDYVLKRSLIQSLQKEQKQFKTSEISLLKRTFVVYPDSSYVLNELHYYVPSDPEVTVKYYAKQVKILDAYFSNPNLQPSTKQYLEYQYKNMISKLTGIAGDTSVGTNTREQAWKVIAALSRSKRDYPDLLTALQVLKKLRPSKSIEDEIAEIASLYEKSMGVDLNKFVEDINSLKTDKEGKYYWSSNFSSDLDKVERFAENENIPQTLRVEPTKILLSFYRKTSNKVGEIKSLLALSRIATGTERTDYVVQLNTLKKKMGNEFYLTQIQGLQERFALLALKGMRENISAAPEFKRISDELDTIASSSTLSTEVKVKALKVLVNMAKAVKDNALLLLQYERIKKLAPNYPNIDGLIEKTKKSIESK